MASAVTIQLYLAEVQIATVKHVPGATTAQVLTPDSGTTRKWYDMATFGLIAFAVLNFTSASSSGPTLLELVCADDTSGTNLQVVVSQTVVSAANASNGSQTAGDQMFLEALAAQIREVSAAAGTKARYASLRITTSNAGDAQAVTILRDRAKAPQQNLTVNVVA